MPSAKRGFAHARPRGDDDQVGALQAAGELVQIGEAGRHADDLAAVLLQVVDLVEEAVEHVAHGDEVFGLPPLRDGENGALGGIERVLGVDPLAEADVDDLGAGVDQAAQRRGALDDAGVVLDVDGGGNGVEQAGEVGEPARLVVLPAPLQLVGEGDEVGRLAPVIEIEDGAIDRDRWRRRRSLPAAGRPPPG